MAISQVIKFEGSQDDLVWKFPGEDFNSTSQLIVDETYQALLVVNGQAADLFGPGRHTLDLPNIPFVKKLISIPTGGVNPFSCKIFFINQVHQMDMLWGTRGAITLNDPIYDIFLHVMLHGSMTFSIADSRKFLIKLVGFRNKYSSRELVESFKGLVSSHVKDSVSKIMILGTLSYFMINANLFEISESVKSNLDTIFDEYGIKIEFFNIETIDVPNEDYQAITKAKDRSAGRRIEGYTWQEERQMKISETFAGNEATMGSIGGVMGGIMVGGLMGGSVLDIAKSALAPNAAASGTASTAQGGGFSVTDFLNNPQANNPAAPAQPTSPVAPVAPVQPITPAAPVAPVAPVQPATPVAPQIGKTCPSCQAPVSDTAKFCCECGSLIPVSNNCPNCGSELSPNAKFCSDCGTRI